jgi:cellulose synthase/poly-beta-1,6-N-acetylglucosamine synthase-like glycosyltransferase
MARAAFRGRGRVVEFPVRRGKAAVLNDLVRESKADVLVFTDANTRFLPGAVQALAGAFADPAVGAACGKLVVEPGPGSPPEDAFWDRETSMKEAEGRLGVCLGANGAIYAARRVLIERLPPDTALDDFLIPARIARLGKRVVFAGGAVALEPSGTDVAAEVSRRFRIGAGAGRVLREESWLWNLGRHRLLSIAFISRKAARWIAPVFALAAAVMALADARLRLAGGLILAAAALAILSARARPRLRGLPGRLYYFCVINVALAAGVVAGLAGYRRPAWRRTR